MSHISSSLESAKIPSNIADKLRGRHYDGFSKFREDLWLKISKEPELSKQFSNGNIEAMQEGKAPIAPFAGHYVGPKQVIKKFEIQHIKPIEEGGGVYDIDNLRITTPKLHKIIHYGE